MRTLLNRLKPKAIIVYNEKPLFKEMTPMYDYKAPLTDMKFLLQTMGDSNASDLSLILDEAAKFAEEQLAKANRSGDITGCSFDNGTVTFAPEMKTAFSQYVDAGWMGITMPETWGGQALPESVGSKIAEMLTSSNHALCMIAALTISACKALIAYGSESLKQAYLPRMVSGEWTGTMCLTEAHCGSDLGLIKTSATPIDDDTFEVEAFEVTGTKIFISAGEHDGSENIIHLVLARIKGAPEGIKGLSLFLVPKILTGRDENCHIRNKVICIGIEEKMGIHGNPTCTLSFEGATGYLVGQSGGGIKAMFTMMNEMRLGTALQGVGLSERAFQLGYHYAIERKQGKTLDKLNMSSAAADPLISHADVRRMLMTQKAFAEGGRALCQYCANLLDASKSQGEQQTSSEKLLGLLTPIAKAFLTETGLASASDAIQVYGGHGFIRESGVEQLYRDGRISTLYEGTTGIQSLDLLGRKVLGDQGQTLLDFTKEIHRLCQSIQTTDDASASLTMLSEQLSPYAKDWPLLARQVGMKAMQDHEEVAAAAYDFLMYSGYVTLAYFWLKMASIAEGSVGGVSSEFLSSKQKLAQFYFERLLPKAESHKQTMRAGKHGLSSLNENEWIC